MKDSVDILIKKCYVKHTYLALLKNYVLKMNSVNTTHLKRAASKKAVFLPSLTAFMTFKKGRKIGIQFQDHGYFSIVSHVGSLCVFKSAHSPRPKGLL